MTRENKDAKLNLREPVASMLADYCAAMNGPPSLQVIRAALLAYIDKELSENPGIRKRYDEIRKARLASERDGIRLVTTDEEGI